MTSLFSDIADAIREKSGSTEQIVADNFPDAIHFLSTGGIGDVFSPSIYQGVPNSVDNFALTVRPILEDIPNDSESNKVNFVAFYRNFEPPESSSGIIINGIIRISGDTIVVTGASSTFMNGILKAEDCVVQNNTITLSFTEDVITRNGISGIARGLFMIVSWPSE